MIIYFKFLIWEILYYRAIFLEASERKSSFKVKREKKN